MPTEKHYEGGGLEPREVIKKWKLNYNLGNIAKLLCRLFSKHETPLDDLIKIVDYACMEIEDTEIKLSEKQLKKLEKIYHRTTGGYVYVPE